MRKDIRENNPSRIKVLIIVKNLHSGGAERYGLNLACSLNKEYFSVSVCAFFKSNNLDEDKWEKILQTKNIPLFYASPWRGNNHFRSYFSGIQRVSDYLKTNPVHIINSHFQLGTITALWMRALGRCSYVVRTAHNHPNDEWEKTLYGLFRYNMISKWIYPLFLDAEVAVSDGIAAQLKHHPAARLVKSKVVTVYNSIPDELFCDLGVKDIPQTDKTPFIIGTVGRLVEQKGYQYLINSIPEILSIIPSAKIWIIGEGPVHQELLEQAQSLGVSDYLVFWGQQDQVVELIKQMDIFILPSLWEGLPTVILEAMACGIPVIATDIAGNRDLVQNKKTGWLIPPRSSEAIVEVIREIQEHPGLYKSIPQVAQDAIQKYRISTNFPKYEDLFSALVNSHHRR